MQLTLNSGVKSELVILGGDVTSADIGELEEHFQRFLALNHYNVIVDLARVTYIGSAGLALLIRYTNTLRRWERGDIYLAAPSAAVTNLLHVAGLLTEERSHFSIYPTVNAAQEAVQKRASG